MQQLEHIEAIEKRLWNAADTLRANSNYASNEYFLPVMGLDTCRCLSLTDTSICSKQVQGDGLHCVQSTLQQRSNGVLKSRLRTDTTG